MANPTKPPQDDWPTFILDLGAKSGDRWTIRRFSDCEKDFWDPKVGWKYSTTSHAWGYWHDKGSPSRPVAWKDATQNLAYPAFDATVTPTLKFPIMNKNYKAPFQFQDLIDPIFSINDVKKTLTALGTRLIW